VPAYIAILEDDLRRLAAMRECVASHQPAYEIAAFDNADEMIGWLEDHLAEVALISLDHDLPLMQMREGVRVDAGDGRMVADWLAGRDATCPVIVHTSNENFGPGMMRVLRDGAGRIAASIRTKIARGSRRRGRRSFGSFCQRSDRDQAMSA
jgi:hypothetical protein